MIPAPPSDVDLAPHPRAQRVLVVDDRRDHRESVADVLRLAGHEVRTAPSGEEALRAVEDGFSPDVLVLDIVMPGMDGVTLRAKLLDRLWPRPPRCILVTAVTSPHVRRLMDPDPVLFKPYSPRDLLAAVAGKPPRAA